MEMAAWNGQIDSKPILKNIKHIYKLSTYYLICVKQEAKTYRTLYKKYALRLHKI